MDIFKGIVLSYCLLIGFCGVSVLNAQNGAPIRSGAGSAKYVLVRIASTEHQFTDPEECRQQAALYYITTTGYTDEPPQPEPDLYRWQGANGIEIRFVVVPPDSTQSDVNNFVFNYWEPDKGSKIKDVFEDLAKKNGWKKKKQPTSDPDALIVNGHFTQRAILEIPAGATGGVKSVSGARGTLLGIIVNPPYP